MKINDLQNGQVVRLRLGRYVPDMDEPKWGLWHNAKLYVARDKKNQVCSMAVDGVAWAEYDPRRDYCPATPNGFPPAPAGLLSEDYYMEIEGLE